MYKAKSVKTVPAVMGLPLVELALLLSAALILGLFIGASAPLLLVALVAAIAIKKIFYRDWLSLPLNPAAAFPPVVLVKGLSIETLSDIDKIIDSGRKVAIELPNNNLLRHALALYIKDRLGFYEFYDALEQRVSVSSTDMGMETLLLSYKSRESLQQAITMLKKRGWKESGSYHQASNLISTVHTQSMSFN